MKRDQLKLEYDSEVDAAYLTLGQGKVVESEEVQPGLIVDLDKDDQMIGVEILRFARRFLPQKSAKRSGKPGRRSVRVRE